VRGKLGRKESSDARRKQPTIPDALLDQLLDASDPRTAFNPDGIFDALKKALAERMLNAEMDQHLSSEASDGRANTRNGYGQKTVLTDTGRLALDIPRGRQGTFDPQLIAKYQRRFPGFDDKIVSLYALASPLRTWHATCGDQACNGSRVEQE
jgi:putative transposase